jgi:hypothetical protein
MNTLMPTQQNLRPSLFLGIEPEERIGNYLEKPLKDYKDVFKKVPLRQVQEKEREIKNFFAMTPEEFYKRLPVQEKTKLMSDHRVKVIAYGFNATEIFKIMSKYIIISTTISFAVNGAAIIFTLQKPTSIRALTSWAALKQLTIGQTIGTLVGGYFGVKAVRRLELKTMSLVIAESDFYKQWQEGKHKEVHELYVHAFKNHVKNRAPTDELLCMFTADVPLIPVRSPNNHVYEKSEIEKHLDMKSVIIQRAIESGSSPEYIEELRQTICPYRIKPFTKDQLVYDVDVAQRVTEELKKMVLAAPYEQYDPVLQDYIKILLNHYRITSTNINAQIIGRFASDITTIGATPDDVAYCIRNLLPSLDQV